MNGPYIKQVVVLDSAWCSKPKCVGVQLCCDLVSKMGGLLCQISPIFVISNCHQNSLHPLTISAGNNPFFFFSFNLVLL